MARGDSSAALVAPLASDAAAAAVTTDRLVIVGMMSLPLLEQAHNPNPTPLSPLRPPRANAIEKLRSERAASQSLRRQSEEGGHGAMKPRREGEAGANFSHRRAFTETQTIISSEITVFIEIESPGFLYRTSRDYFGLNRPRSFCIAVIEPSRLAPRARSFNRSPECPHAAVAKTSKTY